MTADDRRASHQIAWVFDLNKCSGCQGDQDCMRACPYKKIFWNEARRVAQHCIGCFPRLERDVEPGMVKWLHLAGGYGHLRYWPLQWQPVPIDRAIRIDIEKATSLP